MVAEAEYVIGVIGGLGPEATIDFMQKILRHAQIRADQDHPHVIVDCNAKVPNRNRAIAGTGPSAAPALVATALSLERAGADFLVMVCNTAHAFIGDIAEASTLPFVSIVDETCAEVMRTVGPGARIGLLAAEGCYQAGVYEPSCREYGLELVSLEASERRELMECIYKIKAGDHGFLIRKRIRNIALSLVARDAQVIVAACTEVPIAFDGRGISRPYIDSVDVLAKRAVVYARRKEALPTSAGAHANGRHRFIGGDQFTRQQAAAACHPANLSQ